MLGSPRTSSPVGLEGNISYTHLYALTCGVVGCAERAAGVPFSVPGVGAAA